MGLTSICEPNENQRQALSLQASTQPQGLPLQPLLPTRSRFTLLLWPRGEQCGGCRRSNTTDRPHAFQVILADRPCLELSADSEAEMADWMQHLCQAVSKGVSTSASTVHLACHLPRTPVSPPKLTPVMEQTGRTRMGTSKDRLWSAG